MKMDAHEQIYPRTFTLTKALPNDSRGRSAPRRSDQRFGRDLQTKVAGAWLRGEASGQSFYPLSLLVVLAPFILFIVSSFLKTRIFNFSSHSAASDDGEGVSNLWLREYSSDKESISVF